MIDAFQHSIRLLTNRGLFSVDSYTIILVNILIRGGHGQKFPEMVLKNVLLNFST